MYYTERRIEPRCYRRLRYNIYTFRTVFRLLISSLWACLVVFG